MNHLTGSDRKETPLTDQSANIFCFLRYGSVKHVRTFSSVPGGDPTKEQWCAGGDSAVATGPGAPAPKWRSMRADLAAGDASTRSRNRRHWRTIPPRCRSRVHYDRPDHDPSSPASTFEFLRSCVRRCTILILDFLVKFNVTVVNISGVQGAWISVTWPRYPLRESIEFKMLQKSGTILG